MKRWRFCRRLNPLSFQCLRKDSSKAFKETMLISVFIANNIVNDGSKISPVFRFNDTSRDRTLVTILLPCSTQLLSHYTTHYKISNIYIHLYTTSLFVRHTRSESGVFQREIENFSQIICHVDVTLLVLSQTLIQHCPPQSCLLDTPSLSSGNNLPKC